MVLTPAQEERVAQLLNHRILVRTHGKLQKKYRLVELEMYYFSTDHPDPFVHTDPHQQHRDSWYFHRQNGKSYKGGSFKGLDLTFGEQGTYGGWLLRAIEDLEDHRVIEGSCNVVTELLAGDSISELVQQCDPSGQRPVSIHNPILFLQEQDLPPREITTGPRVGLTLKKVPVSEGRGYLMAPYRFTTVPEQLKKTKIGLLVTLGLAGKKVRGVESALAGYTQGRETRQEKLALPANARIEFDQKVMDRFTGQNLKADQIAFLMGYLE